MAKDIIFSGEAEVNGVTFKRGDSLRVSESIYDRLLSEGKIQEPKAKGNKQPQAEVSTEE